MRFLIVEDDFACRLQLQHLLGRFGECHVAVNGLEAVEAFSAALADHDPYDLICMDIMMPEMDGQRALEMIRKKEQQEGITPDREVKVIMISALDDPRSVMQAYYRGGAVSYLVKPIEKEKLFHELRVLGVLPTEENDF